MLIELTPEQEAIFPHYVKKWVCIGNSLVTEDFYTQDVVDKIKTNVEFVYTYCKLKIDRENIIISPSPIMSPFMASAHVVGKVGTPKKPVKCKLPNMSSVENFVNGFSNPMEIIREATNFNQSRYWLSTDAGFRAYVDFFGTETVLGQAGGALEKYKQINKVMITLSTLCYDALLFKNLCCISKKPVYQDFDKSSGMPVAKKGKIKWSDGVIVNV